ncbi:CbbBc protein, partial [Agrobacterium tumefaciens]|nr:CbbBc protein [Agrobacterium tumefaciens]
CLGRTEIDEQLHGPQAITVEDSMSNVHLSAGRNTPISKNILSEPDIVARMAEAVLPESQIKWKWYIESYDCIRDSNDNVFDELQNFNLNINNKRGLHLEQPTKQ